MSAVEEIVNYKKNPNEDYYALLNCDENSTVEQIQTEFKVLALQYHPDKNSDNDAEARFQKLKYPKEAEGIIHLNLNIDGGFIQLHNMEAKETLCDPEKRANYDKWRHSGISISYKNWLGMKEHVHQSMHWATPKTKDRMLPETASASGLAAGGPNAGHRRASEGGAALYYGNRKADWGTENSDVANKFRNYEI